VQLTMFVDPRDVIKGSYTNNPDAWDAADVRCTWAYCDYDEGLGDDNGRCYLRKPRRSAAASVWRGKRAENVGGWSTALNDTPLPWLFASDGRKVIQDGHHRVALAAERGALLPIVHEADRRKIDRSRRDVRDYWSV